MMKSNWARLLILTLVHFTVDFTGGLLVPLPEPTLVNHFGVGIGRVALLLGGCALVVNIVQPLSGALLPRRGLPILLALAPALAGLTACIGLTANMAAAAALLLVASVAVGIVHPEAALAAHSVSAAKAGFGVGLFMSGGYFGFAAGSLISGLWVEHNNQGLANFWLLGLPGLLTAVLVLASGLHRLEGHLGVETHRHPRALSCWPVLALAACIAMNMCLLIRLITVFLVRRFPGQDAQGWGGAAVFVTGIVGALGAVLWGHLSERYGRGNIMAAVMAAAAPFLFFLLRIKTPAAAPLWALGLGLTMGAVFPLSVVLARESWGLAQRLRMGLAIGGAWGLGEVGFILAGKYIGRFPPDRVEPVVTALSMCWVLLALGVALAFVIAHLERRAPAGAVVAPFPH